jgi:mono/diheme cytochrome c family protein
LVPGIGVAQTPDSEVTFADVAPILSGRCVMCHSGPAAPRGLRLDSLEGLLAGGQGGPVVIAGDSGGSELVLRLKGERQPRMPMTGPPFLSEQEIALFERWIAAGLPAGEHTAAPPPAPHPLRPAPGEAATYAQVAPIFATRCAKCHTEQGQMGPAPEGLRLTSYAQTLSSGERARVVPGHPDASELVRRIRGQALPRMPFDGPPYLNEKEIGLIEDWIAQGARNTEGAPAPVPRGARVRLHGRLTDYWQLDGLPLDVSRRTRIDKSPEPGDYVEVRGRLDANGGIEAERIRRR